MMRMLSVWVYLCRSDSRCKPDGDIISWEFSCSLDVFRRKNVESCNAVMRVEERFG